MTRIFVFDTNVLLSGLLMPRSTSFYAVAKSLRQDTVVYSAATLEEFKEKIQLPKFDKYVSLAKRENFYYHYEFTAYPTLIDCSIEACRDPKDDKFLELAKSANADCIITLDQDLLVLHPFDDIPILNPTDFMRRFFTYEFFR